MDAPRLPASHLSVEVSGWDDEKRFFVEKSDLEWGSAGRRTVQLRSRLHTGSLVFVRLLAMSGVGKGYPIAHNAESIELSDRPGTFRVRLVESQPRRTSADVPVGPSEHLMSVGERTKP